ncbi:MAG: hypothetical protein NPMRTH4_360008 [Nitrosopumilales archaeon]|nr:MAG: hypothetical protein NPMRTH4_360008 [Nitrosopumilales archaeon]
MNEIPLDKIKTFRYKNKILVVIDDVLATASGAEEVEFQSIIQDGKFVLIGPKILWSTKDQSEPCEAITVVKTN